MKKKVTILIPCYNEEASLPALRSALVSMMEQNERYDWEILMINDGSKDNTLSIIKDFRKTDHRFAYIDLSRNFGKEAAMLAGFDYAKGDCMVIMDADLQDPPFLIPEMIKYWEEGYDDVYAKRRTRGKESWLRKRLSLAYYSLLQKMSNIDILQNVGDFRLLDRKCINSLKKMRESERYTKGLFCWIGFNKKEILFDRGNRMHGESAWNLSKLFNLALEGITSFTTAPLRVSIVLGFIVSFFALIYMCYIITKTIIWGESVQGFPTLIVVILFLGGVQLLSVGIIGEYIGRIFNETKNRPVYIVNEYEGE